MKITALVENQSKGDCRAKHGLSLYLQTQKHNVLFDLGPDDTLFENAKRRSIDLTTVDTVILSHGRRDHGGALRKFLSVNPTAKIYVQRSAFDDYYTKAVFWKIDIGLDKSLKNHPQIVLTDGDTVIDEELKLITLPPPSAYLSPMNDSLYCGKRKDTFLHEQHLIVTERETVLLMGCGHSGVLNVLEKAKKDRPTVCIGGYHLYDPVSRKTAPDDFLRVIADGLNGYPHIVFYTCHCTGNKAFTYLQPKCRNLNYLSCGESLTIGE